MILKIEKDHQRFRQIVKGRIREDLRKFLTKGELIGKEGKHLISIPVTNTSVNPARSTGPALFAGTWALAQLWLFWLAPLLGGVLAGVLYRSVLEREVPEPAVEGRPDAGLRPAHR